MVQSMAKEEFVFEKLKELDYEGLILVAKVLDFTEQDIGNKNTTFSVFKVIWKYLSSTENETPEGKAIFEKLEKLFKDQIYLQKMNNLNWKILPHHLTKTTLKIILKGTRYPAALKKSSLPEDGFQTLKILKNSKLMENRNSWSKRQVDIVQLSISLRIYMEGKSYLTLVSMSKILRSHFGEPNATTLFSELSNVKQTQNEPAQEL